MEDFDVLFLSVDWKEIYLGVGRAQDKGFFVQLSVFSFQFHYLLCFFCAFLFLEDTNLCLYFASHVFASFVFFLFLLDSLGVCFCRLALTEFNTIFDTQNG